jgi:hypothetical protein
VAFLLSLLVVFDGVPGASMLVPAAVLLCDAVQPLCASTAITSLL